MDFELHFTPENELFRADVRTWMTEHVPKDMSCPADPAYLTREDYEKQRILGRRLGNKGWLYPTYPKYFGGGGLTKEEALIIEQELDLYELPLPPYYDSGGKLAAASIMIWGNEKQKEYFLPPILKGEVRSWQLLTEPEAGSDLANVNTVAVKERDSYILNGQKIFVGSTHGAEWSWVLVNTNPGGKRHENLSWFMIPMNLPGITWMPMDLMFAGNERGAASGLKQTVYFDNVRVPAFNLVGGENNGWRVAGTHLELEHGLMQTSLSGDELVKRVIRVCRNQLRNGTPLIRNSVVQGHLTDMYIDAEIGRLFHLRNYWLQETKQTLSYEGPQAYLHMKRAALRTSKSILKILGPYALTMNPPWDLENGHIEVQQRGSIVAQHPGGTVEIQKVIMARRIGIGRKDQDKAGPIS